MSIERARKYLQQFGRDGDIIETAPPSSWRRPHSALNRRV